MSEAGKGSGFVTAGVVGAAAVVPLAFNPWGFNPFGPAKVFVLAACALLVAIGLALASRRTSGLVSGLWTSWIARFVLALWFLIILSTIVSIDPLGSLFGHYPEYSGVVTWLAVTTIWLGAASLRRSMVWPLVARAVCVSLLLVGLCALLEMLGLEPWMLRETVGPARIGSLLGNPSNLGVYTLLVIPLAFERVRKDRSLGWRITAAAASLAGLAMLLLSGSRGAWLGFLVLALTWIVAESRRWRKGNRRRMVAIAITAAVVVSLTATVLAVPRFRERLEPASTATIEWRFIAWEAAGSAALDRPLLGWGPDSFRSVYVSHWPSEVRPGAAHATVVADPHNPVASAAVSLGFGGAAALLGLITAAALTCHSRLKSRDDDDLVPVALATALAGGLVALMFHFLTLDTAAVLAVLLGLLSGGSAVSEESAATKSHSPARVGMGILAVVLGVVTVGSAGLIVADSMMRGALTSADRVPWTTVKERLKVAQTLAPWEPAFDWATGKAAVRALGRADHDEVYADGVEALEAVGHRMPRDLEVKYDLAYLRLREGIATGDRDLLQGAREVFKGLVAADANNPTYWSASSLANAALGDIEEATADIRTALLLAPDDATYRGILEQLE